jgi:hypothetical protein
MLLFLSVIALKIRIAACYFLGKFSIFPILYRYCIVCPIEERGTPFLEAPLLKDY